MKNKLLLIAGAATGYVLGARAGRERYEQITRQARQFWSDPRVQDTVADAKETAKAKAPEVKDKLNEAAHSVAGAVGRDHGKDTTASIGGRHG